MSGPWYNVVEFRAIPHGKYVRRLRQWHPYTEALEWTEDPALAGKWSLRRAQGIATRNLGFVILAVPQPVPPC